MAEDWRLLRGQDQYLSSVTLQFSDYMPSNDINDHDHCEFCMEKFGSGETDLKSGYCTKDRYVWICQNCFQDFKDRFNWYLKE